jgi:predicted site-specific integrase-resolvase
MTSMTDERRKTDRRVLPVKLRITVAADRMGVHRKTLMRWCEAGKVPGAMKTPGGYWVVPDEWVLEMGWIGEGEPPE